MDVRTAAGVMATLLLLALPFLAAAVLAIPQPCLLRHRVDSASAWLVLAIALSLPWQDAAAIPLLRQDQAGALAAILVALAAVAVRSAPGRAKPSGDRILGQVMLGGMLLAAVANHPVLTAAALALTVAVALARDLPAGWYRVPLCGAGLGLVLFGSILPPSPVAAGCAVLGLATLVAALPVLLPLLPLLALRFAGPELTAIGIGATLACAAGLLRRQARASTLKLVTFGQAGVVGMAFGLGTTEAVFAGAVLLILLVLCQAACLLARVGGLAAPLAAASMAGLPPFGLFPGLALTVIATARYSPWLLVPLLPGAAALGWAVIVRLPTPGIAPNDRWSPAWLPLAAALLVGLFMPASCADWLRALAVEAGALAAQVRAVAAQVRG